MTKPHVEAIGESLAAPGGEPLLVEPPLRRVRQKVRHGVVGEEEAREVRQSGNAQALERATRSFGVRVVANAICA